MLPPSLLADLKDQIRYDDISLTRFDSGRRDSWTLQRTPALHDGGPRTETRRSWALVGLPLGLPALQSSRAHRRPAQCRDDRGFLLGPAMAFHRHVQRVYRPNGTR